MNILFEMISLLALLALLGIGLYQLASINKTVLKTKIKIAQNTLALRVLYKKLQSIESMLQNQSRQLNHLNEPPRAIDSKQDPILTEYEKAKRVFKKGVTDDIQSLSNYDITEEELELLSDLMQVEELNN